MNSTTTGATRLTNVADPRRSENAITKLSR
jgi:hypothetical protein